MGDATKYTSKLNSRILIIGGTSGIGFCVAEAAVEHGASKVIVSSSDQDRVDKTIQRLKSAYPHATSSTTEVTGYTCNLGDEASLESNIENLFEKTGEVDHIVFTAGDPLSIKPIQDHTLDTIKQAGMLRFFAPLLVAKHGSKHLPRSPRSTITLTTGAVSEHPIPDWTVTGAYATALQGINRGLALDLKPVRVNLVSPGGVDTELWDNMGMKGEARRRAIDGMAAKSATGKVAKPEDIAAAYVYCWRDTNVTASMLSTNGGALIV